jgi:hypothetical protein
MLRIHFMQQWFTLSDPAMQEAFFDTPLYREFAQLQEFGRLPDASTILRFGHQLEKHKIAEQIVNIVNDIVIQRGLMPKAATVLDATLIAAPSSTRNKEHKRDPGMHSSKKGEQMYFGIKAHIGMRAKSGLVHTVRGTSGNMPVRICEGTLSRFEKEHRPTRHFICVVHLVDGARQTDGSAGMSAPQSQGKAPQGLKSSPTGTRIGSHLKWLPLKSRHLKTTVSLLQVAASYSDHP